MQYCFSQQEVNNNCAVSRKICVMRQMNNTGEKQIAINKDKKETFCLPKPGHVKPNDWNQLHLRFKGLKISRIHGTQISYFRAVFEDIPSAGSRGF